MDIANLKKLLDALNPGDSAELVFEGTPVKIQKGSFAQPQLPVLPPMLPITTPQSPYTPQRTWVDPTGYPPRFGEVICTSAAEIV